MKIGSLNETLQNRRALFVLTFLGAVVGFLGPLIAYDLWWHLKAGEVISAAGVVPRQDMFSFTAAGEPWVYHSWLSGVLFHLIHTAAGLWGIVLLRSALIGGSLMIAWGIARKRGVGAPLASVLVLVACLQLRTRRLARPYLFSFVLFTIFAALLWSVSRSSSGGDPAAEPPRESDYLWGSEGRLLALPLLTFLWANLHAGFLGGILLLGAFGVGEMVRVGFRRRAPYGRALLTGPEGARFRAMFFAGVFCLLASLATPYGAGTLLYPFRLLGGVEALGRVKEWQPTPLAPFYAVFWAVLAVGVLILARSLYYTVREGELREQAGEFVTDLLLFGGFSVLAVQSSRHLAWVLLLVPPVLGRHLNVSAPHLSAGGMRKTVYSYLAVLLVLVVGFWPLLQETEPWGAPSARKLPVDACDFLEENDLAGLRPYNTYEWGGYLIWRLWPRMRVFVDGRCLLYGDRILEQSLRASDGAEGWNDVLREWDVRMLLVRYRKRPSRHFFRPERWRTVYWDDLAVVALREDEYRRREALPSLDLSNPALFPERVDELPPAGVLEELKTVLTRNPECWTALAMKARCLVRLAEARPEERGALLERALGSAREALRLQDKHAEPWLALSEAAAALGQADLAELARGNAERYGAWQSPED